MKTPKEFFMAKMAAQRGPFLCGKSPVHPPIDGENATAVTLRNLLGKGSRGKAQSEYHKGPAGLFFLY